MAGDGKGIAPQMRWAQRAEKIFLTMEVPDCKEPAIKFTDTSMSFKGKNTEGKLFECDLEFFGELDSANCKSAVGDRETFCLLIKKEDGPFWPRLLKVKGKVHFLHTDFERWVDEDDSDAEAVGQAMGGDANFEDMMAKMGNFNAGAPDGADADEPDSDDEDLPDLE